MDSGSGPSVLFGIAVGFDNQRAVLAVRGEVDVVTAPDLASIAAAVIGRGHRDVVLDLADLEFMSAAGLGVIAGAAGSLERSGGALTIRAPSAMVARMLDITGLAAVVRLEEARATEVHIAAAATAGVDLGPEQTTGVPGTPVLEPDPLGGGLRRLASIPADDDVVDGALRLVVALALATVSGADGVSVSLARHGRLATVAASDQTISDMDAEQYATGEGPCVDASVTGHWFHVGSLDDERRWPSFTPRAQKLGINAILSTPLLARERPIGALNIYSRTARTFAAREQQLASVFASEMSVILAAAEVDASDDELAGRLGEALRARHIIAEAQGVLMEREGVSEHTAYGRLRRASQATNIPLLQEAAAIVASTETGAPAAGPGP